MATKTPMMMIASISSIRVNPRASLRILVGFHSASSHQH